MVGGWAGNWLFWLLAQAVAGVVAVAVVDIKDVKNSFKCHVKHSGRVVGASQSTVKKVTPLPSLHLFLFMATQHLLFNSVCPFRIFCASLLMDDVILV